MPEVRGASAPQGLEEQRGWEHTTSHYGISNGNPCLLEFHFVELHFSGFLFYPVFFGVQYSCNNATDKLFSPSPPFQTGLSNPFKLIGVPIAKT